MKMKMKMKIFDAWTGTVDFIIDFTAYVIVPLLLVFIVLSLFLGIFGSILVETYV